MKNPKYRREYEALEEEFSLSAALIEASRQKLAGKDLTPFLLSRLADASSGRTLQSNLDLLERNARIAGQIAVALGVRPTLC